MPDPCHVCGDQPDVPRRCNHCDKSVCQEHLLPENHDCVALTTRISDEWFADSGPQTLGGRQNDAESETTADTTGSSPSGGTATSSGEIGMSERRQRSASSSLAATTNPSSSTQQTQPDTEQRETTTTQPKSGRRETESAVSRIVDRITTAATNATRAVWNLVSAALRLIAVVGVWGAAVWALWRAATAGVRPAVLWRPVAVLIGALALLRLTRREKERS